MRAAFFTIFIVSVFLFASFVSANTIKVPEDYPTIQEAINASSNGDTVLVASGTYYENLNFRGKNILLTSYYIFNEDVSYISNTIINGSLPVYTDTASCVLFISGEDSTAILQGFTLTGGTGTKWPDEHGAGTYVEGGGILVTLSSPTIKNNLIIENEAIQAGSGIISAGGGGIRVGDGNPHIINNVIMSNSGMYGGGIVLNYTGAVIRNNIIYNNRVYQAVTNISTFGGGGIWVLSNFGNTPKILENNTIIDNSSAGGGSGAAGRGGGVLIWGTTVQAKNNIVCGNTQTTGDQIGLVSGGSINLTYSLIEGGWSGTGNIDVNPNFEESGFYLSDSSECIDAGDPDLVYNDPEGDPGMAKQPAKGTTRNDMGAYGGPGSKELSEFIITSVNEQNFEPLPQGFLLLQNFPNPFNPSTKIKFTIPSVETLRDASLLVTLNVYDVLGNKIATLVNEEKPAGTFEVEFNGTGLPSGIYFYQLSARTPLGKAGDFVQSRKMVYLK